MCLSPMMAENIHVKCVPVLLSSLLRHFSSSERFPYESFIPIVLDRFDNVDFRGESKPRSGSG